MRTKTKWFSSSVLLLALAMVSGVTACGDDEAAPTTPETTEPTATATPPRPSGVTTGVTEDGEGVIFAGHRPTPSPSAHPIDREHLIMTPNTPDPTGGHWTLENAVEGMPIDGDLVAEIQTDLGVVFCDLYADRAPNAVASFIGLARGLRPWWDARAGQWVTRPYYRNLTFHRVIPDYIVQGGDYLEDGSGRVGFSVPLERDETLSHDRAGRLALATFDGDANSGGAQFYITDGPAQALDGTATVFGQCRPESTVAQIARVVQTGQPDNRPLTPVHMGLVYVRRVEGGAAVATVTPPRQREGEPEVGPGASPGPSQLREGRGRLFPEGPMEHPFDQPPPRR
jgi:peptidyl-prolyl cis-trans isomerase A (cyclophilin A)